MLGDYEKVATNTYPVRCLKDVDGNDTMYPDNETELITSWLLETAKTESVESTLEDIAEIDTNQIDWHLFWSELSLVRVAQ